MSDYVSRIHRVTKTDSQIAPIDIIPYPARRIRRLEKPDVRIDVFDYFTLRRCGLQTLIGQRNSSLGKVMADTQQLVYEHRFLTTAKACLAQAKQTDKEENILLQQQLIDIIALKRKAIDIAYWNATFGSPEFEKLITLERDPLPIKFRAEITQDIQAALNWMNALHSNLGDAALQIDTTQLEQHYQRIQQYPYLGKLFFTIALLRRDLNRATLGLQQRLDARPVCYQHQANDTGRILHTVFLKFYVGRVQPYLAQTHQAGKGVLLAMEKMLDLQQPHIPKGFKPYAQRYLSTTHSKSLWREFELAIKAHTEIWQRLLKQCGMMPRQVEVGNSVNMD